ncbi:RNA methyltransferase [Rhizobiaceae bacterium BDR2-2]|uniref:RNA methyltransferase n=1 Tax=Ectorhizobium quercum TaxID=2965071 RepID=A0AAE3MWS5_9HYPH|nr:RNA methyltransferase [Ectorhizobium quercum]MCX8996723.1 RNA methyltransferase [Ectorhizobium quercum]
MAAPVAIDDPDDPRVAAFRDISERDLVGRQGRFIAEGTVVLRMLAAAHAAGRFRAEQVLILENRLPGVEAILDAFPADVPVYVAPARVIDAVAGFHLHRGVLAIGRRPDAAPDLDSLIATLPDRALVLAGCGISNHDNAGSLFRNAAAFGADALFLDETSCDPLYRKALRVSVGSVLAVPFVRQGSILDLLEKLDAAGFAVWGLSPRGEAEVGDIPVGPRMALVMGTEGEGLPQAVMSRFRTARIAQRPHLDSLNVAMAAGIGLYRIAQLQGRI